MGDLEPHRAALIAANQAVQATATILLTLTETEADEEFALDPEAEVPEKLAEALILSIEMTDPSFVNDELRQLLGACRKFIAGWAG